MKLRIIRFSIDEDTTWDQSTPVSYPIRIAKSKELWLWPIATRGIEPQVSTTRTIQLSAPGQLFESGGLSPTLAGP